MQESPEKTQSNGNGEHSVVARASEERNDLLSQPLEYQGVVHAPLGERRLVIQTPPETAYKRLLFLLVAIGIAVAHAYFAAAYWAPAHWGNNQNAYLAGGKFLVTTGTTGFEPETPFDFVGWMWNMADGKSTAPGGGMHYPKYPVGVPALMGVLYKVGYWVGGIETAVEWPHRLSPVSTTLALLATFFIVRLLAGSFAGLLSMVMLGTITVVTVLMENPNSHAPDLAFVCWGMYALLKWWQRGGWWRGAIAGFLLGFAVTIRYTEGLLLLPLIAASLCTIRWHRPIGWGAAWLITGAALTGVLIAYFSGAWEQTDAEGVKHATGAIGPWILLAIAPIPLIVMLVVASRDGHFGGFFRASIPLLAWTVPVAALVTFNYLTVGSPTGYDSTNESTGFTLAELSRKWRWGIDQFYNTGLYFVLPMSVLGMFMAFRWNWRLGLWLVLWFVPGTLLYLSYYWGMNLPVWGFLRFFTSLFPAGVIAAVWLMQRAAAAGAPAVAPMSRMRIGVTALVTVLAGLGIGVLASYQMPTNWTNTPPQHVALAVFLGIVGAIIGAGICAAGRGVAAPIAMGLLVAFPAAINVDASYGALERDYTIAQNLAQVSKIARMYVPDGSVVFGHSQYLHNHLQFAGNYRLIGGDYITTPSRPVPGINGGPDSDTPNPIQRERKAFVDKAYNKLTRADRINAAIDIVNKSFDRRQRVFIIQESAGAGALREALANNKQFEFTRITRWTDPAKFTPAALGALATIGRDGFARRESWHWTIYQITRKSAPTSAPTTHPATAPSG